MFLDHPDFSGHELVRAESRSSAGLEAIIAIHSSALGPAIGGCRIYPYPDLKAALGDVLRLSRGMTAKCAIAGIPYGGGKAVIIADPRHAKTREMLLAMGEFVDSLGGRYITSFDSGTTLDDVRTMSERTAFTAGTLPEAGNASQSTAQGVFYCIEAAAQRVLGGRGLGGLKAAIQGAGNVGSLLARKLSAAGAEVLISDLDPGRARKVEAETGARRVDPQAILSQDVDLFAPCALGGVVDQRTASELKARIVAGGANNVLATAEDAARLRDRGIVYCPDYLVNAGGIVDLHYQRSNWSPAAVDAHLRRLAETLVGLLDRSAERGWTTAEAADAMVAERLRAIAP